MTPSREDATYVYGRGSCDAKGIVAAQIAAAERLRALGLVEIGLLFVVDEEAGSLGAKAANHHPAASRCEYLIDGEPTGNVLGSGSKGSLRVRVGATGRAAHSAYPRLGESAIEKRYPGIGDLTKIKVTSREGGGDWNGRVWNVTLVGTKASKAVSGSDLLSAELDTLSRDPVYEAAVRAAAA